MRITEAQKECLVSEIKKCRPNADIYLFGSRTDDLKRGGDIDILIISSPKLTIGERSEIEITFWDHFGDQKIDLICFEPETSAAFKDVALLNAIPLT